MKELELVLHYQSNNNLGYKVLLGILLAHVNNAIASCLWHFKKGPSVQMDSHAYKMIHSLLLV